MLTPAAWIALIGLGIVTLGGIVAGKIARARASAYRKARREITKELGLSEGAGQSGRAVGWSDILGSSRATLPWRDPSILYGTRLPSLPVEAVLKLLDIARLPNSEKSRLQAILLQASPEMVREVYDYIANLPRAVAESDEADSDKASREDQGSLFRG